MLAPKVSNVEVVPRKATEYSLSVSRGLREDIEQEFKS